MRESDIRAIAEALVGREPVYRGHEAAVNFLIKAKAPTAMLEEKFWHLQRDSHNRHELYELLKTGRLSDLCYETYICTFGLSAHDVVELNVPANCHALIVEQLVSNGKVADIRQLVGKHGYALTRDQWDRLAASATHLGATSEMLRVIKQCSPDGVRTFANECCVLGRFEQAQEALGSVGESLSAERLEASIATMAEGDNWYVALEAARLIPRELTSTELQQMLEYSLESVSPDLLITATSYMGRPPTPAEWCCIGDALLKRENLETVFVEVLPRCQSPELLEDVLKLVIRRGVVDYLPPVLDMLDRELTKQELNAILAKHGVRRSLLSRICS